MQEPLHMNRTPLGKMKIFRFEERRSGIYSHQNSNAVAIDTTSEVRNSISQFL